MILDIAIIAVYILFMTAIGMASSRADTLKGYFLGGRSVPWPLVCFSIVATETSTLTFISIPGLAYITDLGFLQIALGYILGRIIIALFFLPRYFSGDMETAYQFLEKHFGVNSRRLISVVFHVTRLLADSIRLFVTAIPLALLMGMESYWPSILLIGTATFIYTLYGGIKSVIVVDSIQLLLYLSCAFLGIYLIMDFTGFSLAELIIKLPPEKLRLFSSGMGPGGKGFWDSYTLFSGLIGGAFLSLASHGTDQLIVQRVLSCGGLKEARKAMVLSGIVVFFQFALFMFLGLFIFVLFGGKPFDIPDKIVPAFIITRVPHGARGLMLAGIFAAAMSTLSSSINSLSSSTVLDILRLQDRDISEKRKMRLSRVISFLWSIVIMGIALMLTNNKGPLVELGLSIASLTYGGMLAIFVEGLLFPRLDERAAAGGVLISIILLVIIMVSSTLFWPWYVPVGFFISLASAGALQFFNRWNCLWGRGDSS